MKLLQSIGVLFACSLVACQNQPETKNEPNTNSVETALNKSVQSKLFERVPSSESNVSFVNRIVENDQVNYYKYEYMYNGGGVGIGDLNNDGLQDIIFTANMGPNRVYMNEGNMQFADAS